LLIQKKATSQKVVAPKKEYIMMHTILQPNLGTRTVIKSRL
jgi:hypothetical protein